MPNPFGGNIPRLPGIGQQPQPMGGTFGGPPGGGRPGMTPPPQAAPPQGNPFAGGAPRPGMFGGQGAQPPAGPPQSLPAMFGARPPQGPPAGAPPQAQGLMAAAQNNPQFADRLKQAQAAWQMKQMQPQGPAVEPISTAISPPVVG